MKNVARSMKLSRLITVLAVFLLGGCFGASQDSAVKVSLSPESAAISADAAKPQAHTEIAITPGLDNFDSSRTTTPKYAPANVNSSSLSLGQGKKKSFSERERVKEIGVELAQKSQNIKKLKICHDRKNAEWWFTCYEDLGDILDLKQYVWKIDQDQPEPFLVIKRISKDKLQSHLSASDPDKTCRVLDQSREGWVSVLAAAFGSDDSGAKGIAHSKKVAGVPTLAGSTVESNSVPKAQVAAKIAPKQKPRKQMAARPVIQADEDPDGLTENDEDVSPPLKRSSTPKRNEGDDAVLH